MGRMVRCAVDTARADLRGQTARGRRLPVGARSLARGARVRRAAARRAVLIRGDRRRAWCRAHCRNPGRESRRVSRSPGRPIRSPTRSSARSSRCWSGFGRTMAKRFARGSGEKLGALQAWCRGAGKPLVIEVLVPRRQESEEAFETAGRPAMLAGFIGEAYRRGLTPEFWKIEGTLAPEGARTIDRAIAARPQCRQIILGKAADFATIERWFAAASGSPLPSALPSDARSSGSHRRRFLPAPALPANPPRTSAQTISGSSVRGTDSVLAIVSY